MSSIHGKDSGKELNNTKSFKITLSNTLSKNLNRDTINLALEKLFMKVFVKDALILKLIYILSANHYSLTLLIYELFTKSGVIKLWDDKSFLNVKIKFISELIENLNYFRNYWDLEVWII